MKTLNEIVASRIAERSLIGPLGGARELAREFTGPDKEWLASSEPGPHELDKSQSPAVLSDADVARLTKQQKLRDISDLQYDRTSLERELRSMVRADTDRVPREFYALCSLTEEVDFDETPLLRLTQEFSIDEIDFSTPLDLAANIKELADVLAALHPRYPALVRFAMQGRLASAATLVNQPTFRLGDKE